MIAKIAPLLRLPRGIGIFDYRCPRGDRFVPGQIVAIPFRKKVVPGIIIKLQKTTDVLSSRIRPIAHPLVNEPVLTEMHLSIARRLAVENYASIATVMRSLLPRFAVTKQLSIPPLQRKTSVSREIRAFVDAATKTTDATALVTYTSFEKKCEFYRTIGRHLLRNGSSTLILTPTITAAENIGRRIPHANVFLHTGSVVQRRKMFITIRAQGAAIVVGTRSALLAPVQRLGAIIVDDEEDDGHLQTEPNPRFDCRRIAAVFSRISQAKLILLSRMPSLSASRALSVSLRLDTAPADSRRFIDLEEQRRAGDYAIITAPAMKELTSSCSASGTVLVVHHHRTFYASLECGDCGFVPVCTICQVPYHQDADLLVCHHCASSSPIPVHCPRCHGIAFKGRGRGIQHVVNELRRAGIDRSLIATDGFTDPSQTRPLIIMTAAQVHMLSSQKFTTIVVTRFDSEYTVPRYDADERARRLIVTLSAHCTISGTLIVQSSPHYRPVVQDPYSDAWRTEAYAARERFGFPPACKVLMLRQRFGTKGTVTPERLFATVRSASPSVSVTPPQRSRGRSRPDRGGTVILIRYRNHIPEKLRRFLSFLDDSWTITVNPIEFV